jgi:hypothetical protein
MQLSKQILIIPTIALMSSGVFADNSAVPPQGNYPPQQQQDYYPPQDQYSQQGYAGPIGCGGGCGQFNPGQNFYCPNVYANFPCPPPILPFPGPPLVGVPLPAPIPPVGIFPPIYGGPPIYGRPMPLPIYPGRPGFGGPRFGGPGYPTPYRGMGPGGPGMMGPRPIRRVSSNGCEVQQGNNGEFAVISADGEKLYSSKDAHAEQNAEAMKVYYEKSPTGLCGTVQQPSNSTLDI